MIRLVVVGIVMGLAIATNPLLPDFVRNGRLPPQRVEYWEQIVEQINSDGLPVCFYPNLVEDSRSQKKFHHSGVRYYEFDYLEFAVRGIYPVYGMQRRIGGRVEVLSLITPQAPSNSMLKRFEESGGGWVLIRARQTDAKRVLEELPEWYGSKWKIEYEDFSLPPLYLFRIKLVEVE